MMTEELGLSPYTYEREFWKRYHTLRQMVAHLKAEEHLVHQIKSETVIPEQARDLAIRAIRDELADTQKVFLEFLYNFIGFCSQGLHRADILVDFTALPGDIYEIESCYMVVDGRREEITLEVARRFIDIIPVADGWEAVLEFYRREETRFDQILGGDLDRCSLKITEELFPSTCYHITIRLPAQILIDLNPFP
jgi:hypothetical protein